MESKKKSRKRKKKESRKEQKNLNAKNARKKLRRIINANFDGDSWYITLTYKTENRPKDAEELQKTLEDIHKQWNDEEEVLEAFRDVLDKKKYIYESNGRWA